MALAPRSKRKTLELCMEMYEWLRDNGKTVQDKYEWPRSAEWKKLESHYHNCFCCMFANFDCMKCPLKEFAWELARYGTFCTNHRSLYSDTRYCGADKMVWACYVALHELDPKTYPLDFARITNP